MFPLQVNIGTMTTSRMMLDLDKYGDRDSRCTREEDEVSAIEMLEDVLNEGSMFANAGNRNYGAVNGCIALHVLGYKPDEWFERMFKDDKVSKQFYYHSITLFMDHVKRVADYVDAWGPAGNEGMALYYAL